MTNYNAVSREEWMPGLSTPFPIEKMPLKKPPLPYEGED